MEAREESSTRSSASEPGDSPRSWGWPPTLSAVVAMALMLWGLIIGLQPLRDNSFLTHLATGRIILETGVPTADPYSFTAPGETWVVQSWLASLLYASAERLLGGDGIVLMLGLTTAVLAGLVWWLTRPAVTLLPRLLVGGVVLAIGSVTWTERPLLFGLLFMALLLVAAQRGFHPAWVVPVFWLWVNTHGSWPLGIVVVALLLAGSWIDERHRPDLETRILAAALIGVLLGAVNPLGPKLLIFPVELLQRQEALQFIVEWRSPSFTSLWSRIYLVQIVIAVLALMRRPSWRSALLLCVFVPASLLSARNIAVASLVLVPGMAAGLSGLGSLDGRRRSPVGVVGSIALSVLALVVVTSSLNRPNYRFSEYPSAALVWLGQQDAWDGRLRIATNDFTGNLLEGIYGPEGVVFFDDRYDMYPSDMVDDVIALETGRVNWEEVLEDRQVDVIIWPSSKSLAPLLAASEAWRVVLSDDDRWVVACHRDRGCDSLMFDAEPST